MTQFNEIFLEMIRMSKEHPGEADAITKAVAEKQGVQLNTQNIFEMISQIENLYQKLVKAKKEQGLSRQEFFMQEFERIAKEKNWGEQDQQIVLSQIEAQLNSNK